MSDAPAGQERPGWPPSSAPRNGMGTAALVLGIVGLVLLITIVLSPLAVPVGIAAVVVGILGRSRARRGEATNQGSATAGIVMGALAVVAAGVLVAVGATWIADNADEIEDLGDCLDDANTEQERDDCANRFEDQVDPND
jgi:hypothetical protein